MSISGKVMAGNLTAEELARAFYEALNDLTAAPSGKTWALESEESKRVLIAAADRILYHYPSPRILEEFRVTGAVTPVITQTLAQAIQDAMADLNSSTAPWHLLEEQSQRFMLDVAENLLYLHPVLSELKPAPRIEPITAELQAFESIPNPLLERIASILECIHNRMPDLGRREPDLKTAVDAKTYKILYELKRDAINEAYKLLSGVYQQFAKEPALIGNYAGFFNALDLLKQASSLPEEQAHDSHL